MKVALGIDIGGTNTAFGFVNSNGKIIAENSIATQKYSSPYNFIEGLHLAIDNSIKTIEEDVELIGIGVGAPNANHFDGTISNAANLPWEGSLFISDILEKHYDLPVFINNDANAAAMGEMIYGSAKGMKNFIVITLGTGLGSGIVVNGDILYGHNGLAGEVGHIIVSENGRECGCGRYGCLETYVSATGIKRSVYEMLAKYNWKSVLKNIPFNKLDAKIINKAAVEGDFIAIETFKYTGTILGKALANLSAITNPEAIFILGGLAKSGELILEPTKKALEENLLHFYKNKIKLLPSGIDDNAAILGASAMVW